MEGGKKVVAVIVLLIVIVGGVALLMKRKASSTKPPSAFMKQPFTMIDRETHEMITRSLGEWQADKSEDGKFRNPNTGNFTMAEPIVCASCGATIPMADIPRLDPNNVDPGQIAGLAAEIQKKKREYMCPKCGKNAYRILGG